jgi:glycosyltransferase involved in cell wall biosynthesis
MKICVTGLRGIPGVMGGVETHCEELMPRIVARDPELDIEVCARAPYVEAPPGLYRGVRVTALRSPRGRSTEAIGSTLAGVLHAWRNQVDVLHIHAVGPALLAPLARLLGMKVVFTHHGADYDRAKWGFAAKAMLRLGEWAGMRFANRAICVSPSLRRRMVEAFPGSSEKTAFIPNGAATLPPAPGGDAAVLGEFALEAGQFILCVARLVPEKGLHYLIEAHRESGTGKRLVIAGAEMHGDDHARKLKGIAGPLVTFTGALPRPRLAALYRNCAVFVLPSFHEGLPIAALEAISAGCPVLLSDIQPNRDLELSPDHYFAVGNAAELAGRLRGDFGHLAGNLEAVSARFDWEAIARETAEVYRSLGTRDARAWPNQHATRA